MAFALTVMSVPVFGQDATLDLSQAEPAPGIPGIGPLTNDQIKKWLSESENHETADREAATGAESGRKPDEGIGQESA